MDQSYLFETDNLGFRPVKNDDLSYLLLVDSDPETRKFIPGGVQTAHQIKEKLKKYIESYNDKGYGALLVFDTQSGEFIGRTGLSDLKTGEIEVGYLVLRKFWGKGYATRILKAILAWAKENIQRNKVIAFTPTHHHASEKVMCKAGMIFSRKEIMKGVECVIYEYKL